MTQLSTVLSRLPIKINNVYIEEENNVRELEREIHVNFSTRINIHCTPPPPRTQPNWHAAAAARERDAQMSESAI